MSLSLCCVLLSAAGAAGREGQPASASQLEALRGIRAKIRRVEAERLEKRREQRRRLQELAAEKRSVAQSLESYARKLEELEKQRDEAKGTLDELAAKTQALGTRGSALLERMDRFLEGVERRIRGGIPWKVEERLASLEQARKSLQSPAKDKRVSPGAALAAVGRIQKEEEAQGRLVETGVVEVKAGGERIAVQAFHLGLLAVVFASEDGSILGFAGAGATLEDGLKTVADHPEAADGYLRAVDILRRRRTPEIVGIFFHSMPTASSRGRKP
jgi:hypothetical protein